MKTKKFRNRSIGKHDMVAQNGDQIGQKIHFSVSFHLCSKTTLGNNFTNCPVNNQDVIVQNGVQISQDFYLSCILTII